MIRNIIACGELGAQGVVIGALNKRGEIDKESISLMIENAKGMEVTFHRAFDDTANYKKSLDVLIDLGVKRLLSSGLEVNVERGMENLREMVDYARGRIEIMTGGGVNLSNVSNIVKEVKPDAIHFSGTKKILLDEGSMFSETILKPDRERIRKVQMALS